MFAFVKDVNDYYIYALIVVLSQGLVALMNILHIRKYLKLKLTTDLNIKEHFKPILVLFSNSMAVLI
jgi:hypothetical protein